MCIQFAGCVDIKEKTPKETSGKDFADINSLQKKEDIKTPENDATLPLETESKIMIEEDKKEVSNKDLLMGETWWENEEETDSEETTEATTPVSPETTPKEAVNETKENPEKESEEESLNEGNSRNEESNYLNTEDSCGAMGEPMWD